MPRSRSSAARIADWGEEVVACVVVAATAADGERARALERELDALCLERIARFKRPKAYVFLAELPKNNTGKVLKTDVARARVLARVTASDAVATRDRCAPIDDAHVLRREPVAQRASSARRG